MYLLDTHVLLWWFQAPDKLSDEQTRILSDPQAFVWLSAASVWEISIKSSLGKLTIPSHFWNHVEAQDFRPLSITSTHAKQIATLPPLHHDPFDRILISQALTEQYTILTSDEAIKKYDVSWI